MKMIDVLELIAKGKIEPGAKLKVIDIFEDEYEYEYKNEIRTFLDEEYDDLGKRFDMNASFLNSEVHLEQPSKHEYKYRIKLPHSEFYVGFARSKEGKKEFIPYVKDSQIIEMFIQGATENGLKFKTEFTEQEFEGIVELYHYQLFKELVKDDENE